MLLQTVNLYRGTGITSNFKPRGDFAVGRTPSHTYNDLQQGHLQNFNALVDFAVHLPVIQYEIINCDVVELILENGVRMVGLIQDVAFVNANSSTVNFQIDPWCTGRANGWITQAFGNCARTNVVYQQPANFVNLLPEPFAKNDRNIINKVLTDDMWENIIDYEGISSKHPLDAIFDMHYAVSVSSTAAFFLGLQGYVPWVTDVAVGIPRNHVEEVTELNIGSTNFTVRGGEMWQGSQYIFSNMTDAQQFISNLTTGRIHYKMEYETDFYNDIMTRDEIARIISTTNTNQWNVSDVTQISSLRLEALNMASFVMMSHDAGGAFIYDMQEHIDIATEIFEYLVQNWNDTNGREAWYYLTGADIVAIHILPQGLMGELVLSEFMPVRKKTFKLTDFHDMDGVTGLGAVDHAKLLHFPFNYYRIRTIGGGSFEVIPQLHFKRDGWWGYLPELEIQLTFIGGMNPTLYFQIIDWGDMVTTDMIPIKRYPVIRVSTDDTSTIAEMADHQHALQLANTSMNVQEAQANRMTQSVGMGALVGIGAGAAKGAKAGALGGPVGAALGAIAGGIVGGLGAFMATSIGQAGEYEATMNAQLRAQNQGNIRTSDPNVTTVFASIQRVLDQPVNIYHCGASNAELWSINQAMREFGESVNANISALSNTTIWGGLATSSPRFGKQYFQFSNIRIDGNIPSTYRDAITQMFIGGCWLY